MPTISLTSPVAATTITAGLHATNFSILQTLLNGGLDNANMAPSAAMAVSKLAGGTNGQVLVTTDASTVAWGGGWQAYTPTFGGTGASLGNGTKEGRYVQIGKTVIGYVRVVRGSTTTFGTLLLLGLPVACASPIGQLRFQAFFLDASAGEYAGMARTNTSSEVAVFGNAGGGLATLVTDTHPFTWASTDEVWIRFVYEAA